MVSGLRLVGQLVGLKNCGRKVNLMTGCRGCDVPVLVSTARQLGGDVAMKERKKGDEDANSIKVINNVTICRMFVSRICCTPEREA